MLDRKKLLLYAITDRRSQPIDEFIASVEEALRGGVTILQLREKNISRDEYVQIASQLLPVCRKYSVPLIINDDADAALAAGADGVHLGACDASVREVRKRAGKDFIIGATAKTVDQALRAEEEGADYLGVGAVFHSPTKPGAVRITPDRLREICSSVSIPAVAIGGISAENALSLSGTFVSGLAVVSAVFGAGDVFGAAKRMKKLALAVCGTDKEGRE
ncbi:MAG: thiamine phosphate synthase [Clostridia bacterium]|nr:thiamine phosphate synthase [Clostridia bacterium]